MADYYLPFTPGIKDKDKTATLTLERKGLDRLDKHKNDFIIEYLQSESPPRIKVRVTIDGKLYGCDCPIEGKIDPNNIGKKFGNKYVEITVNKLSPFNWSDSVM